MKLTIVFITLFSLSVVYGRHIAKHHKTHDEQNKQHLKRDGDLAPWTDDQITPITEINDNNTSDTTPSSQSLKRHEIHQSQKKNHIKRDGGDLASWTDDQISPITEINDNNTSDNIPSSTPSQSFKRHETHQSQKKHHIKRDGDFASWTEDQNTPIAEINDNNASDSTPSSTPSQSFKRHGFRQSQNKNHIKRDGDLASWTEDQNTPITEINDNNTFDSTPSSTPSQSFKRHGFHQIQKKNRIKRDSGDLASWTEDQNSPITEINNNNTSDNIPSSTPSQSLKRHGIHQRQKKNHIKRDSGDLAQWTEDQNSPITEINDNDSSDNTPSSTLGQSLKRHGTHQRQKKNHLKRDSGDLAPWTEDQNSPITEINDNDSSDNAASTTPSQSLKRHGTHQRQKKNHLKRDSVDLAQWTEDQNSPITENNDNNTSENIPSSTPSQSLKRHGTHQRQKKNHLKRDSGDLAPWTEDQNSPIAEINDNNTSDNTASSTPSQSFKRHGTHHYQKKNNLKRDSGDLAPWTEDQNSPITEINDNSTSDNTGSSTPSQSFKRHGTHHHQKKNNLKRDSGDLAPWTEDQNSPITEVNDNSTSDNTPSSTPSQSLKRHGIHQNQKKSHIKRDGDFASWTEDQNSPITEINDNNTSDNPPSSTPSQSFKRHGFHQSQKKNRIKREANFVPWTENRNSPITEINDNNTSDNTPSSTPSQSLKRHGTHQRQKKNHLKRDSGDLAPWTEDQNSPITEVNENSTSDNTPSSTPSQSLKRHGTHQRQKKNHLKRDSGDLTSWTEDQNSPVTEINDNNTPSSTSSQSLKRHGIHQTQKKNHMKRDGDLTWTESPITETNNNNASDNAPYVGSSTSSQSLKRHGTHQHQKKNHIKRDGADPNQPTELSSTELSSNDFPSEKITTNYFKRHGKHHQKKLHLKRDGGEAIVEVNDPETSSNSSPDFYSTSSAEPSITII